MTTAVLTDALLDAQRRASRHVLSERTNDVRQVMETVSQTVCYMMPDVTSPDHELMVLTDRDDVRTSMPKSGRSWRSLSPPSSST